MTTWSSLAAPITAFVTVPVLSVDGFPRASSACVTNREAYDEKINLIIRELDDEIEEKQEEVISLSIKLKEAQEKIAAMSAELAIQTERANELNKVAWQASYYRDKAAVAEEACFNAGIEVSVRDYYLRMGNRAQESRAIIPVPGNQ